MLLRAERKLLWANRGVVPLLLLIVLGGVTHLMGARALFGLDLSEIQLIAFPLMVLLFLQVTVIGFRLPAAVLWGGTFAASVATGYSYLYLRDAPLSIVVAHLQQDEFEARTRQFREAIRRQIDRFSPPLRVVTQRSHETISSQQDAAAFLNASAEIPLVVWGGERWVTVSIHSYRGSAFDAEALAPWLSALGFTPVTAVPVFGLSRAPEPATAEFLASLLSAFAISRVEGGTVNAPKANAQWVDAQLLHAATQQAPWTSFAHRGYAWWILGNRALARGASKGRYEPGEIRCAIEYYTRARQSLKAGDNPELLAAVLNNRAIAQAISAVAERRGDLRTIIRRGFKAAVETKRERNLYHVPRYAPQIARRNLERLLRSGLMGTPRDRGSLGGHRPKGRSARHPAPDSRQLRRARHESGTHS